VSDEIERVVRAQMTSRWRKVALVIASAADTLGWSSGDDELARIETSLGKLIDAGEVEARGSLTAWRDSEVRLK
jgi:hypothetical protein